MKYSTIGEMLKNNLRVHADAIAFEFLDEKETRIQITYEELYYTIISKVQYFESIGENNHIGIIANNSFDWIVAFISIVMSDNIAVAFDPNLPKDDLINQIHKSDIKALYIDKSCFPKKFESMISTLKNIDFFDLKGFSKILNIDKTYKSPINDPDKIAAIFFTSGTSNYSKPVMLSNRNLCTSAWCGQESAQSKASDSHILILPLYHIFGFICSLLWPWSVGSKIYLSNGIRHLISDFTFYNPNIVSLVPAFAGFLLSNSKDTNLSSVVGTNLHTIVCGSASIDKKLVETFKKSNINLLQGYGLTETTSGVAITNPLKFTLEGMEICAGVDAIIHSPDKDGIGEIYIKGDNVMIGYYKDEKATRDAFDNGWLRTGDLGYFDDKDLLHIVGRIKSMLVLSSGQKIFPEEIEQVLDRYDEIGESMIEVIDHDELLVSIVPNETIKKMPLEKQMALFNRCIQAYNKTQPYYRQINEINISNKPFPRSSSGNILRYKIKKEINIKMDENEIRKKLLEILIKEIPEITNEDISDETIIKRDLGLDSLNFVSLVIKIELAFGITIPEGIWLEMITIGDAVRVIQETISNKNNPS